MGADTVDRRVTVAVVEDLDVVMEGVSSWVARDPLQRVEIVAGGADVETVLAGPGGAADVIVLDLELRGRMATPRVRELADAGRRVVVYSVHNEPLIVESVLAVGACAFLDKDAERDEFVDTVVDVARDLPHVTRSMAGGMLESIHFSGKEQEALLLLFQGMDHASIARRMNKQGTDGEPISKWTVKQYIERARARLAAAGRPCASSFALLARCIELGLIQAQDVTDYRSIASAG